MEKGDIYSYTVFGQACVFEDLLAERPTGAAAIKEKFYIRRGDWEKALKLWKPNDLPLKSLIDAVERRGINTAVITFLPGEAVEEIYRWLLRKGVSCTVTDYASPEDYEADLRYDRSIKVVYVPSKEIAYVLGMRATVVSSNTAWGM
jgi:hypothetical protein